MPSDLSRREFVAGAATLAAAGAFVSPAFASAKTASVKNSPFKISVITDEISSDFAHACEVAAQQFGMGWVEVRTLWVKNVIDLDPKEIAEAVSILKKLNLRITDIAAPLFKVDWPDAPKSKFSPKHDSFKSDLTYAQQEEVLERCIELARKFSTERIRCFDFWRLDDPAPHRKEINDVLRKAADKAGQNGLLLVLENEFECNTGTGAEAAQTLAGVPSPSFMLNWDPGNAARLGEVAYPDGYNRLPKDRIGHCHVKDVAKTDHGLEWAAMGQGTIDWAGQFAALKRDGYRQAVSLETHWRGAGTPEASSIASWSGMKTALQKAHAL
jgi:sugar phosphate isomerase/epimerase